MEKLLNPRLALIFRIVHVDNLPWMLDNGLHCRNCERQDPSFVSIGHEELIRRRDRKRVPVEPGGVLSDYIPFYFTPLSPMLLNIITGRNGVRLWPKRELVVLVSSIHRLHERSVPFVFTNQHAVLTTTSFHNRIKDLTFVDWPLLQSRNFRSDDSDAGRLQRYMAEALVHQHVSMADLLGIVCCDETTTQNIQSQLLRRELELPVKSRPDWFFP